MRYWFIMFSNSWYRAGIVLLLVLLSFQASAQQSTFSPYSIYGIGDPVDFSFAQHTGMGGTRLAVINGWSLNPANPAAWATITKGQGNRSSMPLFEAGFSMTRLSVESVNSTTNTNFSTLRNVAFGVPISNKIKAGVALVPYTAIGYELENLQTLPELGTTEFEYRGEGGLNRVLAGVSYSIVKDSLQHLSFGTNFSYLFGIVEKIRTVRPNTSSGAYSVFFDEAAQIRGLKYDFGTFYQRSLNSKLKFTVGATYSPSTSLNADFADLSLTFFGNEGTIKDTLSNDSISLTGLNTPASFGFGLSFSIASKLTLAADYEATSWSDVQYDGVELEDATRISFGLQYVPNYQDVNNLFSIVRYRAGVRYNATHMNVNGNQVEEYGINFGLGIPLLRASAKTSLNLAVDLSQRGVAEPNSIREQFATFSVGITMAPNATFDRWFVKRKID